MISILWERIIWKGLVLILIAKMLRWFFRFYCFICFLFPFLSFSSSITTCHSSGAFQSCKEKLNLIHSWHLEMIQVDGFDNVGAYAVLKPPLFDSPLFLQLKAAEKPEVWNFDVFYFLFFPPSEGINMDDNGIQRRT